jgi:hypothetical protein
MPLRTWNGSSWETDKHIKVWNGSAWTQAKSAKVWNGSSWVNFHSTVNVGDYSVQSYDTNLEYAIASSIYRLNGDGTVYWAKQEGGFTSEGYVSDEWLVGGSASDISARATITSSFNSAGAAINGTFGSWMSITSVQPQWDVNATAITNFGPVSETAYVNFTLELAYTADTSKILDSAAINIQAIVDAFT